MCHKHSIRLNFYGRNSIFGRDRFEPRAVIAVGDTSAGSFGSKGIFQKYRNISLFYRRYSLRVQDLGSKICQLCRLFEGEMGQSRGIFHISRIIIVKSVNICPYLYFISVHRSSNNGCRIITTSPFKGADVLVPVNSHKSLRHINFGS